MAGLYVHIPFCKKRCNYCDFYSCTLLSKKQNFLEALRNELQLRCNFFKDDSVRTVYFGGGTPSLLSYSDWKLIFEAINKNFDLRFVEEFTLEANPDDISDEYIQMLSKFPFNRISLGIQTFNDETLRLMNRRHDSIKAKEAISLCEKYFSNISLDLIYGNPNEDIPQLKKDLDLLTSFNVQHISAYHLTYEEGTILDKYRKQGKVSEIAEETSVEMYSFLVSYLKEKEFLQYEISNFARKGMESKHNSSYWNGVKYLGIGPSAHSFDGETRFWNVASVDDYTQSLLAGKLNFEQEFLSKENRYNEYLITKLRTTSGISLAYIEKTFGLKQKEYCLTSAQKYVKSGKMQFENEDNLRFTQEGFLISDKILSDILWAD